MSISARRCGKMDGKAASVLALLSIFFTFGRAQNEEATSQSGDGSGGGSDDNAFSLALIAVAALIGVFALVIVLLVIAIMIMCRKKNKRRVDYKTPANNTYRGFSRERTQSPLDGNAVHQPNLHQISKKSRSSHSPSHLPTSPPTPSSSSHPHSSQMHTYNHLHQHNGMTPLPSDYPENKYSRLGPRSETPPSRPPKPPHLRRPLSNAAVDSLRVSSPSTLSPRQSKAEAVSVRAQNGSIPTHSPPVLASSNQNKNSPGALRTSIYDTMEGGEDTAGISTTQAPPVSEVGNDNSADPRKNGGHELARRSSSRKSEKAKVRIFDDPDYLPIVALKSPTVKTTDPRYAGNYERHPDYIPMQGDGPKDQLREKYIGDYERDPMYFSKLPDGSFSVSDRVPNSPNEGESPNLDPRLAKYEGEYERSEDYIPPHLQNRTERTRNEKNGKPILRPQYSGDYERHPDYVPPLLRTASQHNRVKQDEMTSSSSMEYTSPFSPRHHKNMIPAAIPHEYTALADVLRDPPQEYACLHSTQHSSHTPSAPLPVRDIVV